MEVVLILVTIVLPLPGGILGDVVNQMGPVLFIIAGGTTIVMVVATPTVMLLTLIGVTYVIVALEF